MIWCPFFDLPRRRSVAQKLDAILTNQTRMETIMAQTKSELLAKIEEAQAAVDAERKAHADDITAAVEKARAAWEADDAAEHAAALDGLNGLINSLKSPSSVFSPSAN